nr:hypothetical protein [Thermoproteota archaeon]
ELPDLREVLAKAKNTIEVLATTNEYMLFKDSDFIKDAMSKNIKVTILLPDPNSEYTLKNKHFLMLLIWRNVFRHHLMFSVVKKSDLKKS